MELRDFISQALKDIIAGVKDAQQFAADNEACINPYEFGTAKPEHILDLGDGHLTIVQPVMFDLCVEEASKTKGSGGIQVLSGSYEGISTQTSRIKFSVAVSLPRMKPNFDSSNPEVGIAKCGKPHSRQKQGESPQEYR